MKILISLSAVPRLSAKMLEKTYSHSFHAGAQRISVAQNQEISWNYVGRSAAGKTIVVTDRKDALGIACRGKYYPLA